MLTMPDFEAAAAHPAPVVCDATLASPLRLRPLEQGCDVSLHSATKVLAGHDDVIAGVATVKDDALFDRLHLTRRLTGLIASADTAWLLERGLQDARGAVRPHGDDRRASWPSGLAQHPAVTTVRYPGFGFLISFDVADGAAARRVEIGVESIENATSLGGTAHEDRVAPPLGRRSLPGGPAAAVRRARGAPTCCGPISSRRLSRAPDAADRRCNESRLLAIP